MKQYLEKRIYTLKRELNETERMRTTFGYTNANAEDKETYKFLTNKMDLLEEKISELEIVLSHSDGYYNYERGEKYE